MDVQLNVITELGAKARNNPDQEWMIREYEQAVKVAEAVEVLDNAVNRMDAHLVGKIMFERMTRMHRTLQQGFMGAMLDVIHDYSKLEDNMVDARNDCSREIAQHMIQGIVDAGKFAYRKEDGTIHKPTLPLI